MHPPDVPVADEVVAAAHWEDRVDVVSERLVTVSTLDLLHDVTPSMFAWWFAHLTAESYQLFHPTDHANFAWTEGKRPGAYVGATHRTHHRYGGRDPVLRSAITFLPPPDLFSDGALRTLGTGHALAAAARPLDVDDMVSGPISAYFVHVVLPRAYGSEMRSKWWLAVDRHTDLELVTTGRTRHVHEEFGHLQAFLPGMYAAAGGVAP